MRVGVLQMGQFPTERPSFYVKKSVAEDLVIRGHALWIEPGRVIQRLVPPIRAPKQLGFATVKWP
jgi:hypothetical protein